MKSDRGLFFRVLATPADRPWKLVETYFDVLTQRMIVNNQAQEAEILAQKRQLEEMNAALARRAEYEERIRVAQGEGNGGADPAGTTHPSADS